MSLIFQLEKFLPTIGLVDTRVIRKDDDFEQIPNMSQGYFRRNEMTQVLNRDLIK